MAALDADAAADVEAAAVEVVKPARADLARDTRGDMRWAEEWQLDLAAMDVTGHDRVDPARAAQTAHGVGAVGQEHPYVARSGA